MLAGLTRSFEIPRYKVLCLFKDVADEGKKWETNCDECCVLRESSSLLRAVHSQRDTKGIQKQGGVLIQLWT